MLQANHQEDNWFLQIETFDPHEPFFAPAQYQDLYPHDYDRPLFDVEQNPQQTETLDAPALKARMIQAMHMLMDINDAPPEQYVRLGLT